MVTTRRKPAISYKDISDDDTHIDGLAHNVRSSRTTANDDTEDDYDDDVKPKRKKTKTASKTTTRKGKVTARSLMKDLFSILPLDLIYEIFEHLRPLDLLHLARTSKMLRCHLMSKRSISVWMTAREAVFPPVPECPNDQSEPQWAMLLFTHDCTMCGTPRIQKVDWNLRLRCCKTCFKNNVIDGPTALRAYPDIVDLDMVLELLPWTNTGGLAYGRSSSQTFYFSTHIVKMAEIVEDFQLRIDAGVKAARAEFDEFKEKKKAEAAGQAESGKELKEWVRDAARRRLVTEDQLRDERKQAMIAKLIELGHDPRDVQKAATGWNIFDSTTPLSDSVWKRAKPKAEMLVEEERQLRLDVERQFTRDARRNVAKSTYTTFKGTYDASPDLLLPSESDFMDLPMIKAIIRTDGDDISPGIFNDAFDELPAFLDKWRRERRVELARILLESQVASGAAKPDPITAEQEGFLYLATSFFSTCTQWGRHECTAHWMTTMHRHLSDGYHWRRSKSKYADIKCVRPVREAVRRAELLIASVGLDPKTTTQLDMDGVDARFWCTDCSVLKGRYPNVARNWRNCIMHLDFHATRSSWKGWEVLTSEDRATVETLETSAAVLQDVNWNTVAISLQGRMVDLEGNHFELKAAPALLPPLPAGPSNLDASRSQDATATMHGYTLYPDWGSPWRPQELADEDLAWLDGFLAS
ncbi:hypothetical protein FRC05_008748 [Tulasnella sp. 425]|nr:hypothetical protein FRC05_008748 [Tulasnella sp. 425]